MEYKEESAICEECRQVNPGRLKNVAIGDTVKILCKPCRIKSYIPRKIISATKYAHLETRLNEHEIPRPTADDILTILPELERQQALNYRAYFIVMHPDNYRVPTGGNIKYIHQNLDSIVSENLDRIKEIISEIESEKQSKKEE